MFQFNILSHIAFGHSQFISEKGEVIFVSSCCIINQLCAACLITPLTTNKILDVRVPQFKHRLHGQCLLVMEIGWDNNDFESVQAVADFKMTLILLVQQPSISINVNNEEP